MPLDPIGVIRSVHGVETEEALGFPSRCVTPLQLQESPYASLTSVQRLGDPELETCAKEFPRMDHLQVMTLSARACTDVPVSIEWIVGEKVNPVHVSGTRWNHQASKRP